eukprot:7734718-Pyramimonas_sp.AAC.1
MKALEEVFERVVWHARLPAGRNISGKLRKRIRELPVCTTTCRHRHVVLGVGVEGDTAGFAEVYKEERKKQVDRPDLLDDPARAEVQPVVVVLRRDEGSRLAARGGHTIARPSPVCDGAGWSWSRTPAPLPN